MKRSMRSVGSMSDFAELFNGALKTGAADTLVAGKFVANKVYMVSHNQVSLVSIFM